MCQFDRFAIVDAYWMYSTLWGHEYNVRLHAIGYRPSCLASLETLEPEAKRIYGALVRRHNRLMVGFDRLARRQPALAGQWPGTYNIPRGDVRAWLASRGLLDAVLAMVDT